MKNQFLNLFIISLLALLMSSCSEDSIVNEMEIEQPRVYDTRSCGHTHHMNQLLKDPVYKESYDSRIRAHKEFVAGMASTRALCSSPVKVPVAVHFQGVNSPNVSCLRTLATESIAVLNSDYQGNNGDITNWTNGASSTFPSISFGEAA